MKLKNFKINFNNKILINNNRIYTNYLANRCLKQLVRNFFIKIILIKISKKKIKLNRVIIKKKIKKINNKQKMILFNVKQGQCQNS